LKPAEAAAITGTQYGIDGGTVPVAYGGPLSAESGRQCGERRRSSNHAATAAIKP
jgi:hypothetical protein